MRRYLTLFVFLLPASRKKNRVLRLLGHDVALDCHIGPNLIHNVGRVSIASGAHVGPLNVFRSLLEVRLAKTARIGQLNWFSTAPDFLATGGDAGRLVMDEGAAVVSRHHVDCSGGVLLRRFSILGGMGTIVLTHHVSHETGKLECLPVEVCEYSLVNAANRVVAGVVLPHHSITGIGSVLLPGYTEPYRLYAGVPARDIKSVSGGRLFNRDDVIATL